VLPQAGEKRSHPSADIQVINGVPNADYCHLKAVGFALLGPILCQAYWQVKRKIGNRSPHMKRFIFLVHMCTNLDVSHNELVTI
jgi:hypothetical protein